MEYVCYKLYPMRDAENSFIKQVIYVSKPVGFDDKALEGVLVQSKQNNKKNQITGL